MTIPVVPRARAGIGDCLWVHLTYPDKSHRTVAYLRPEDLRPLGESFEKAFRESLVERMSARAFEVGAQWLRERGYVLTFVRDDEFVAWADRHFLQKKGHYRVSPERLRRGVGGIWIEDPEVLDDEDFINDHPRCLRAMVLTEEKAALSLWRFPWKPDGAFGWYAAPTDAMIPEIFCGPVLEALLRALGPGFWDAVMTILVEMGIPADYDALEADFANLKAGRLGPFADVRRRLLAAA